ncbi:MAG: hypothetical protein KAS32_12070 [Candidatus Peribacteraceae bacterium]|nr:hypothetical protein [Candidatus Peribacteraceae bacterium]
MVQDKDILLEVPIDNEDGTFTFTDFKNAELVAVRPSKNWPVTFEGWKKLIKYLFSKDLPKPNDEESFDDIWRTMPPCIQDRGNHFWLNVCRNIGGVEACYLTSKGEIHDEERLVFLMAKPFNAIENDEPAKALAMLRENYKAWMPE